ncbi:tape measure protein [Corynebacterium phocae]|nr:tape measure protein [Corynebacterium phocae]
MALDLGELQGSIKIDIAGAERDLMRMQGGLERLEKSLGLVEKNKLDIKPRGERELKSAGRAADDLGRALSSAETAAKAVKLDARLSSNVRELKGAADQAATGLGGAAKAADNLGHAGKGIKQVEGRLESLAGAARNLIPALSVGAFGGTILSKGWARLTGIDDAQFKLKGLGHEAESIESIMDSALASVMGTAYGLSDAATAAGNAVASGVEVGDDLTRSLSIMADTAAIAGAPLNEISRIFGQVRGNGKLMREELLQLSERGIPVFDMLAKSVGVTKSELNKMVSDGKLGIEDLERALEQNLGGAAKAMGGSITGSIANLGAALGRLGATAMEGGFSQLPGVLESATGAVDDLSGVVEKAVGVWGGLPGPVKQTLGVLLAVKGASVALGTEIGQKLTAKIADLGQNLAGVKGKVGDLGAAFKAAYQQGAAPARLMREQHILAAAAAQKSVLQSKSAFAAIDLMGQQAAHGVGGAMRGMQSVAAGSFGAMKLGAKGLLSFFGGPWVVGIGAAVAVLGKMYEGYSTYKKAEEEVAQAVRQSEGAHDGLTKAMQRTNGTMTGESVDAATEYAGTVLTQFTAMGEAHSKMFGSISDAMGKSGGYLKVIFGSSADWDVYHEHLDKARAHGESFKALNDVMRDMGLTQEDLNKVVAAGGEEYVELVRNLTSMGEAGQAAANELTETRRKIDETAAAAKAVDDGFVAISGGLALVADESASAEQKLTGVLDVLREMGLIEESAEDAMWDMADAVSEVVDGLEKWEDVDRNALFVDPTGGVSWDNLDKTNEKNKELRDSLAALRDEYVQTVQAGGDSDEAWKLVQDSLGALTDKTVFTREEIDQLAESLGLMPDEINTILAVQGTSEAVQQLDAVWGTLKDVEDGAEVHVGVLADEAVTALEGIGYKVEELKNSDGETIDMVITAKDDDARSKIQDLVEKTSQLDDAEITPDIWLDNSKIRLGAEEVDQIVRELNLKKVNPEAEIDLRQLFADGQATRTELAELSRQTAIPVADLDKALFDAGVKDGLAAAVNLDSQRPKPVADLDTTQLKAKASEANGVLDGLKRTLSNVWDRITGANNAARSAGSTSARFATGGRHGGYQLPVTGPGTHETDGFLALDKNARPIARLDAGEWIINGQRSERFSRTLGAINSGSDDQIAQALTTELTGYADGGRATPAEVYAFVSGKEVNGYRAKRPLEGATYDWGGMNWGDCSGAVSAGARFAAGVNPFGGRFATGNEGQALSALGAQNGVGSGPRLAFGWFNGGPYGGHTAATLYGLTSGPVNLEMGGSRGNGQIGGQAAGATHPSFTDHAHIDLAGGGDGGEILSTSVDGMTVKGQSGVKSIDWGTASALKADVEQSAHRARQLARYRRQDFDEGGVATGIGWMPKNTVLPERRLNPAQTVAFEQLPGALRDAAAAMQGAAGELSTVARQGGLAGLQGVAGGMLHAVSTGDVSALEGNPALQQAALAMYDQFGNAIGAAADMKATEVLAIGERLGLGFITQYATGIVGAYEGLEDSYVAQVDAADALKQANKNVEIAQRELAEAQGSNAELSTATMRKIQDAEEELAKVKAEGPSKSDMDGSQHADKVAKAEKHLARVREDATKELEGNGVESLEALQAAQENLTNAEDEAALAKGVVKQAALATGHAEIAMAVEVAETVYRVGKAVWDWIVQTVNWFNQIKVGEAQVYAQAMENQANLSGAIEAQTQLVSELQMKMVDARIQMQAAAWDVQKAQVGVLDAHLQGLKDVATAEEKLKEERDKLLHRQIYDFTDLSISYDDYINRVVMGIGREFKARTSLDARATAERLAQQKDLTTREQQLVEDVFAGKFAGFDAENASIAEQRQFVEAYYAAEKAGIGDVLVAATHANAELLARQQEVYAAEAERLRSTREATLEATVASYRHQEAVVGLTRLTEDMARAQDKANRLASDGALAADKATVLAEIAKLKAENAAHQATLNDPSKKIGAWFDWDGDGKVLGLGDNKDAQDIYAAKQGIAANEQLLREYEKRLKELGGGVGKLSAEDEEKIRWAGLLKARGEDKKAEDILRTTSIGKAGEQLRLNDLDDRVNEIQEKRLKAEREREDMAKRLPFESRRVELEREIMRLGRERDQHKHNAEGFRTGNAGSREASYVLADHNRAVAQGMSAFWDMAGVNPLADKVNGVSTGLSDRTGADRKVIHVNVDLVEGGIYTSEWLDQQFTKMNEQQEELDMRVTKVQSRLDYTSPQAVMLQRAGR